MERNFALKTSELVSSDLKCLQSVLKGDVSLLSVFVLYPAEFGSKDMQIIAFHLYLFFTQQPNFFGIEVYNCLLLQQTVDLDYLMVIISVEKWSSVCIHSPSLLSPPSAPASSSSPSRR